MHSSLCAFLKAWPTSIRCQDRTSVLPVLPNVLWCCKCYLLSWISLVQTLSFPTLSSMSTFSQSVLLDNLPPLQQTLFSKVPRLYWNVDHAAKRCILSLCLTYPECDPAAPTVDIPMSGSWRSWSLTCVFLFAWEKWKEWLKKAKKHNLVKCIAHASFFIIIIILPLSPKRTNGLEDDSTGSRYILTARVTWWPD